MILSGYIKDKRLFERLRLVVPAPDEAAVLEFLRTPGSGYYVIFAGDDMEPHPETAIQQRLILVDHEMGVSP